MPVRNSDVLEVRSSQRLSSLVMSKNVVQWYAIVIFMKLALMVLFSSGYMTQLFIPFISHFVEVFDNPWDYFYKISSVHDQFPYQPLMLYLLSIACLPLKLFGWENHGLVNFFVKLPTLASDILIAYMLSRMFPNRLKEVFWYYFLSPIVVYACYVHSQLDLIPTALLFSAVFYLRRSSSHKSSILLGLALATKTHVAAVVPLLVLYTYKNCKPITTAVFVISLLLTAVFFIAPYAQSPGFQALVLHNPRQTQLFSTYFAVGSMHIYLPIFAVFMAYGRFALYPKINLDLLDAFLTIVFALFVLLIVPSPGWYVWISPFLSLFMIKYSSRDSRIVPACLFLYVIYLFYFLFFHQFEYADLIFFDRPLNIKIVDQHLSSVVFTMLETTLLAITILCYRIGVRSNSHYKRDKAIVIGIGGDSGAGKSTLLKDLKSLLHESMLDLEGDADHKWERSNENWKSLTHLDPKANFLHRQAETLFELKRGRKVKRVEYDHVSGAFTQARVIAPRDFIVISGLHTFYLPNSRKVIDLKIFLDPDPPLRMRWKFFRDKEERGYTEQEVTAQLNRRKSDVDQFIAPQREFADISISYYATHEFETYKIDSLPDLRLKLSMSSGIRLDDLVNELMTMGLLLNWEYNENLSKQDLTISAPVPKELLQKFASDMIPNLDELVSHKIEWEEGFRGFVQLTILLALNDLMKEKEDASEH